MRCYSYAYQRVQPTYAGCSVASEWLVLSVFTDWMRSQQWHGMNLDKDILLPGNKVYSAETCVFISPELNRFLSGKGNSLTSLPLGVSLRKDNSKIKIQANCHNPFTGKQDRLGYFDCPYTAHEAWRAKKHEHALRYADMQEDPRIAGALRVRFAAGQVPNVKIQY